MWHKNVPLWGSRVVATYISKHERGGWRFTYHIPGELRGAAGGKTAFRHYIKPCSRKDAEDLARRWAVEYADEIKAMKALTPEDREAVAAAGGWDAVCRDETFAENKVIPVDERTFVIQRPTSTQLVAAKAAAAIERKVNEDAKTRQPSWDMLYNEWVRIQGPKAPRGYATVIAMLKNFFGEHKNLKELTPPDIGRLRGHLSSQHSRGTAKSYLGRVNTMFAAVVLRDPECPFHGMPNPCAGIRVLGKDRAPKRPGDRSFTAEQAKHILETTERTKFGLSRKKNCHADILLMLRLFAFTGARMNEIAQLQGGDVEERDGVRFINIREEDAITGKPHPQKSVKTGEARWVPIHPMVAEFFDHARKFAKGEFIFRAFPWSKGNGRAGWLISHFPKFLEKECEIVDETQRLTLYSLRHRFHDAMDEARIPEKQQKRLTGHATDNHGRYGGKDLQLLAEYVAQMKPTG